MGPSTAQKSPERSLSAASALGSGADLRLLLPKPAFLKFFSREEKNILVFNPKLGLRVHSTVHLIGPCPLLPTWISLEGGSERHSVRPAGIPSPAIRFTSVCNCHRFRRKDFCSLQRKELGLRYKHLKIMFLS